MLQVEALSKRFGGLQAVDNVSFAMNDGEVLGVIGPNGAGKTTCFNLISGSLRPDAGRITYQGQRIDGMSPAQIAECGLARTFQLTGIFANNTVLENVMMGAYLTTRRVTLLDSLLHLPRYGRAERAVLAQAERLTERVGLAGKHSTLAANLPYGDQRRLAIAIALAAEPRLLMLDEPAAGLNPTETGALLRLVRTLAREQGISIMLIDHDMKFVMSLCDRILVLSYGRKLAEGTPEAVRSDPEVIRVYLGSRFADGKRG